MKILLTGITGQLGYELYSSLQPFGIIVPTVHPNETSPIKAIPMDLTNPDEIIQVIKDVRPSLIVNAAAFTDVDKAEDDFETAMKINCHAPWLMAELANLHNFSLIHYSTDYVYSGAGNTPWKETDEPNPINAYGTSKLIGDQAIVDIDPSYFIFRTSWLYGIHGHNFIKSMLRLGRERETLKVVNDQIGALTCVRSLANITAMVLSICWPDLNININKIRGIYHVASDGETSWYGVTKKLFELAKMHDYQCHSNIIPILSEEYTTLKTVTAKRPKNSRLSCQKLYDTFGIKIGHWEQDLEWCLPQILKHFYL